MGKLQPKFGTILALAGSFLGANIAYAGECSVTKTNHSCTLTLDRLNPLAPPTIQMYPGESLTVVVVHPYPFERYFLDYSSGQVAVNPDVATSVVTGLLPSLKNVSEFMAYINNINIDPALVRAPPKNICTLADIQAQMVPVKPTDITSGVDTFYTGCLRSFASEAREIYMSLEPVVAPDAHPQGAAVPIPDQNALDTIAAKIANFYDREVALSTAIGSVAKLDVITPVAPPPTPGAPIAPPTPATPTPATAPPGTPALSPEQSKIVRNWVAASALADAVAKDLYAFATRITDLKDHATPGVVPCSSISGESSPKVLVTQKDTKKRVLATPDGACLTLSPIGDPPVNNTKIVTRQVTYAIDALNLIQNSQAAIPDPTKKKTLASVTVFFGDTRWEASAGALFSTLAVRSFSIAPVLSNGTLVNKQVSESVLHPTVVPFAAANYRITDDWKRPKWRMATYWTVAVGINPNTVSTDFATGPSISWRGLMFSGLWHVGHDVRLTQGLYKGQILDPSFSASATTQNYWRLDRVALGISVRVPSLTGR